MNLYDILLLLLLVVILSAAVVFTVRKRSREAADAAVPDVTDRTVLLPKPEHDGFNLYI